MGGACKWGAYKWGGSISGKIDFPYTKVQVLGGL